MESTIAYRFADAGLWGVPDEGEKDEHQAMEMLPVVQIAVEFYSGPTRRCGNARVQFVKTSDAEGSMAHYLVDRVDAPALFRIFERCANEGKVPEAWVTE